MLAQRSSQPRRRILGTQLLDRVPRPAQRVPLRRMLEQATRPQMCLKYLRPFYQVRVNLIAEHPLRFAEQLRLCKVLARQHHQ